ncbi:MAG: hypothetical protein ACTS22_07060 [Phycisphaerales bacterium]
MPTVAWIILGVIAFDLFVVFFVIRGMASNTLTPLAEAFPPAHPEPVAVERRRQSFSFGLLNLGFCFRVTTDAAHLHLRPEPWARWMHIPDLSLPWTALTAEGQRRGRVWAHAIRVETGRRVPVTIRGPRWLWDLVAENARAQPA